MALHGLSLSEVVGIIGRVGFIVFSILNVVISGYRYYKNKIPAAIDGGFWTRWFIILVVFAFCERVSAGTLTVCFLLKGLGITIIMIYCIKIKELFYM